MESNINVTPLIKRLKKDIKESQKLEKKYARTGEYAAAMDEVNNQENFLYFIGLIREIQIDGILTK